MGTLSAFLHISVDGYFVGPNGETDWFHQDPGDDFNKFIGEQASAGSTLLFGRTTYEEMVSFWPTDEAARTDPHMTDVMRNSPKIVFSRTMDRVEESPTWRNVELWSELDTDALAKAKADDVDFTVLGSGSIVQQLTEAGLVDDYNLVLNPVVLGAGRTPFESVDMTRFKLRESRSFKSGLVWLAYEAA